jgi:hypothetical protein
MKARTAQKINRAVQLNESDKDLDLIINKKLQVIILDIFLYLSNQITQLE